MKKLSNLGSPLSNEQQKKINGGLTLRPSGCASGTCVGFPYICQPGGNGCAVPGPGGSICYGTHDGSTCCLN